jgi:hypothetical protein
VLVVLVLVAWVATGGPLALVAVRVAVVVVLVLRVATRLALAVVAVVMVVIMIVPLVATMVVIVIVIVLVRRLRGRRRDLRDVAAVLALGVQARHQRLGIRAKQRVDVDLRAAQPS